MIKGKDKPFKQGKPYSFPKFVKNEAKGKYCELCSRWRSNEYYIQNSKVCTKCKEL